MEILVAMRNDDKWQKTIKDCRFKQKDNRREEMTIGCENFSFKAQ